MPNKERIHAIIHTAAASAAAVGGGMAQLPCTDAVALAPLQAAMISMIAAVHGHPVSDATAVSLLETFAATTLGRAISQLLIGWWPGMGNVINATTAAALTETIGWAADSYFESLPNIPKHEQP